VIEAEAAQVVHLLAVPRGAEAESQNHAHIDNKDLDIREEAIRGERPKKSLPIPNSSLLTSTQKYTEIYIVFPRRVG
jgi:hypothetical protein